MNGQFAIALYDHKLQQFLLVRDQIGIAPLFYTVVNGKLVFASEIKAILQYPGVNRRLNLKAVDQLMNYPGVISPNTFFEGIYALPCGHMICSRIGGELKDIEYWDLVYQTEEEKDRGEKYYIENLRELLKNAIDRRLVADVPIGFYISGGLDSSMVACCIAQYGMNSSYSFRLRWILMSWMKVSFKKSFVIVYIQHIIGQESQKKTYGRIWDRLSIMLKPD